LPEFERVHAANVGESFELREIEVGIEIDIFDRAGGARIAAKRKRKSAGAAILSCEYDFALRVRLIISSVKACGHYRSLRGGFVLSKMTDSAHMLLQRK